jgi:putative two-component system response regulator
VSIDASHLGGAAILILDDQRSNITLLEAVLKNSGFSNLSSSTDPREVESLVHTCRPDLVVLDLQMPHLDGFEVMRILQGLPEAEGVPVLIVTPHVDTKAKLAALEAGATDLIVKPYSTIDLLLRLKNLLQIRFLQQRLSSYEQRA